MIDRARQRQATRRTPAQVAAAAVGVVLLVIGVLGLVDTGFSDFGSTPASSDATVVAGLGGSTLLNLAHVVLGAFALLCASGAGRVRLFGLVGSLAFLALTAYDVVSLINGAVGDPLGTHWPALILHVACLVVAGAVVFLSDRPGGPDRA
ncbi:DUF4383 domain-containing protein [Actinokineospora bangkokensis]|uniref:DUF4383 domain-containing protein n=1 Tax=Actinokineospora bangkokensis TaxID=1193682 RepID=A0A1Q9LLR5_9PSEU|nr:DUF4383 domain-containing protein [Actinokineospora bangkokensis]OLR92961.1 hypothetical protein BJP25_18505 [Actinokineospora bangkokensis]